jgi:probable phosphoglycerate mutase
VPPRDPAAASGARQRLVLIRHGETDWSRTGQHTSRTDIPLTPLGREQAEAVAAAIRGWRFARVFTSPRQRARDTARLAGLATAAEVLPDLAEWDYGQYEGRTTAEIRREVPGWSLWRDGAPGGERAEAVERRADRVLTAVRLCGGDVAVFAHGHILRVLAARWLGMPGGSGRFFLLDTATVSVLGWEREVPVVVHWNVRPGTGALPH